MKRPNSMRHLDDAIRRLSGNMPQDFVRMHTVMASAIVASMLPDGVVKGGSALKMRFGDEATRFTTDLDTATATDPAIYAALAKDLPVLQNIDDAVRWVNETIVTIDNAR